MMISKTKRLPSYCCWHVSFFVDNSFSSASAKDWISSGLLFRLKSRQFETFFCLWHVLHRATIFQKGSVIGTVLMGHCSLLDINGELFSSGMESFEQSTGRPAVHHLGNWWRAGKQQQKCTSGIELAEGQYSWLLMPSVWTYSTPNLMCKLFSVRCFHVNFPLFPIS